MNTETFGSTQPGPEFFKKSQNSLQEFKEDFEYKTNNPYREKLQEFSHLILQDLEGEKFQGKWKKEVFKNSHPLHLEIGTGYGHFLEQFCHDNENINLIGMDYRFKRSFQLTKRLAKQEIENTRLLRAKGERVNFLFSQSEIDQAYFFFPDPWPKNRHLKKRLFQIPFLEKIHHALKPDGLFYIKTDHDGYAKWMKQVMDDNPFFEIQFATNDLHNEKEQTLLQKYQTKFEKIFITQNKNINGFILKNKK